MNTLVLNSGSSSIKFSVFDLAREGEEPNLLLGGELTGMDGPQASLAVTLRGHKEEKRAMGATVVSNAAIGIVLDAVAHAKVDAVGYRVVHPGPRIKGHIRLTEDVLEELEAAAKYAPLHDPEAVAMMRETMRRMPHVPHIACFDTVFHQTMPEEASTYPIPKEFRVRGVRRYGFHGLSCESVVRQMKRRGPLPARMAIAHLGSGCSVTAVLDGQSIDTTMGLTPTGGVVMGTRPGDLDPGLLLYLLRQDPSGDAAGKLEQMLNHQAGLVALTGLANNMKVVREAAEGGNVQAILALKVFTRCVRKAIGGFAWLMGGLDTIVFTGGIGEHDRATRLEILSGTEVCLDGSLDQTRNTNIRRISASNSRTAVFAVTAQEDLIIALHVRRMIAHVQ